MIKMSRVFLLSSLLVAPVVSGMTLCKDAKPADDFGAAVRAFSEKRHALALDLSKRLNIPLPPEVEPFFRAAITGTWDSVSNRFEQVWRDKNSTLKPEISNELWSPVLETFGIWEVWVGWKRDSALLARFHEPIIASMPKGSIYFGGTDHGRFVITTANALQNPPPVYCITQNALADGTYAAHLRAVYGKDIWLPKEDDSAKAFQRFVQDVQSGKRGNQSQFKIVDGRVQVTGALGVMEINGILCEMIFDHNKETLEFFVEESYVLSWMYPYLEPHGLIMKLNRQPLEKLSAETVAKDRECWDSYEKLLQSHPGFADNTVARNAFSKLRCAIAGIYVYRKMYDEAEAAFQQAVRICPSSPEANARLVKVYEEQDELPEALRTLNAYLTCAPPDARKDIKAHIKQLESQRQGNDGLFRMFKK